MRGRDMTGQTRPNLVSRSAALRANREEVQDVMGLSLSAGHARLDKCFIQHPIRLLCLLQPDRLYLFVTRSVSRPFVRGIKFSRAQPPVEPPLS